jgi:zona occludens toxin (predicted ATPase)
MDKLIGSYVRNNKSSNFNKHCKFQIFKLNDISEFSALSKLYKPLDTMKESKNNDEKKSLLFLVLFVFIIGIITYALSYNFITFTDETITIPVLFQ